MSLPAPPPRMAINAVGCHHPTSNPNSTLSASSWSRHDRCLARVPITLTINTRFTPVSEDSKQLALHTHAFCPSSVRARADAWLGMVIRIRSRENRGSVLDGCHETCTSEKHRLQSTDCKAQTWLLLRLIINNIIIIIIIII